MMLSKCGDVIQQWKIFLPKDRVATKKTDVAECLRNLFYKNFAGLVCNCPVSCYEMYIDTAFESKYSMFRSLDFQYLSNTVTEIRERPAYPESRFITDIGGWLSLFTGMSVLSILEFFIFIILCTIALFQKLFKCQKHLKRNDDIV